MPIADYIINDIQLQPLTRNIGELTEALHELNYTHIPVGENQNYRGCISKIDLQSFDLDKTLGDYEYALSPFFTRKDKPLLDVLKTFVINDSNMLPLLAEETNSYLGYIELNDVISLLNEAPFFKEEGNIILIEKEENNFSFSEIAQIIESNKAKIYGMYISDVKDHKIQVTLKTGNAFINEILQSFRRYDYEIISEHQEDSFLKELEERSAYLNKYLNI